MLEPSPGVVLCSSAPATSTEGRQYVTELDQIVNDPSGLLDAGWPAGKTRHPGPHIGHASLAPDDLGTVPRRDNRFVGTVVARKN